MQEKVKREIKAMKKLNHPHIIHLYEVIDVTSDIFLVLEMANGGDLFDTITTNSKVSCRSYVTLCLNASFFSDNSFLRKKASVFSSN